MNDFIGHGGFPEWYPLRTYPYPVPGPWSYNPVYPAGYAGPDPYFEMNDDGTMTQLLGADFLGFVKVEKKQSESPLWLLAAAGLGYFLGRGL